MAEAWARELFPAQWQMQSAGLLTYRITDKTRAVMNEVGLDMAGQKPKTFDKVEEVTIDTFVKDIIPTADTIELMVENKHECNMFSLIAMGVGAAFLFSVVAVLFPQIFPDGFRDSAGHVGVYFEAGAVIVVLVLLGQIMELGARERVVTVPSIAMSLVARTTRPVVDAASSTVSGSASAMATEVPRPRPELMPSERSSATGGPELPSR